MERKVNETTDEIDQAKKKFAETLHKFEVRASKILSHYNGRVCQVVVDVDRVIHHRSPSLKFISTIVRAGRWRSMQRTARSGLGLGFGVSLRLRLRLRVSVRVWVPMLRGTNDVADPFFPLILMTPVHRCCTQPPTQTV